MMTFRNGPSRVARCAAKSALLVGLLMALGIITRPLQAEEPTSPTAMAVSTPAVQAPTPVVQETPKPETPPPTMKATENLKADYIGADACLACHNNQAGFKDSFHARMLGREKGIDFQKTCETCHGPGSLHAEAAGDRANPGFATINNMKGDVSATCLQCHNDQRRVHWASGVHKERGLTCTTCHSVHNPKSAKFLLQQVDEKTMCFTCHQNIKGELHRNSHMPVLEGKLSCGDCHNPHGSATDKMLVADNVNQLCYKCHAEKRGPYLWTHPPVQENCLTCHVPHGSHNDKMLQAKLPMLCQRCHMTSGHNYSPYDASQAATFSSRMGDKSCANCHINIHGSNHPSGKYFQR